MPKSTLTLATAAYALVAISRSIQLMIERWNIDVAMDMLVGGSIRDGLAWPGALLIWILNG